MNYRHEKFPAAPPSDRFAQVIDKILQGSDMDDGGQQVMVVPTEGLPSGWLEDLGETEAYGLDICKVQYLWHSEEDGQIEEFDADYTVTFYTRLDNGLLQTEYGLFEDQGFIKHQEFTEIMSDGTRHRGKAIDALKGFEDASYEEKVAAVSGAMKVVEANRERMTRYSDDPARFETLIKLLTHIEQTD